MPVGFQAKSEELWVTLGRYAKCPTGFANWGLDNLRYAIRMGSRNWAQSPAVAGTAGDCGAAQQERGRGWTLPSVGRIIRSILHQQPRHRVRPARKLCVALQAQNLPMG